MPEGIFVFELALAESAVLPQVVVVSRVEFGTDDVQLHSVDPSAEPIVCPLDAAAPKIAQQFTAHWNVAVDVCVFAEDEVAPSDVNLPIRWREIHRDLSLTGLLRNTDPDARLVSVQLDAEASQAIVVGGFRGQEVTVRLPLLDDSYSMWEAMYTFIERAEAAIRDR